VSLLPRVLSQAVPGPAAGPETRAAVVRRLAILLLVVLLLLPAPARSEKFSPDADWEVYFSPNGGATAAIVREINQARQSVYVQAYSFTSAPIARALLRAQQRGVAVAAILDKSQQTDKYSAADFLVNAGIKTMIDSAHAIAHNKVMVIDEQTVITGSFNFTRAAEEKNAENLLVIRDAKLAARYLADWREHAAHATVYAGRQGGEKPAAGRENGWLEKVFNTLEGQLLRSRRNP